MISSFWQIRFNIPLFFLLYLIISFLLILNVVKYTPLSVSDNAGLILEILLMQFIFHSNLSLWTIILSTNESIILSVILLTSIFKLSTIFFFNDLTFSSIHSFDGLEFYEKILKDINKHIKKPGLIALEIGMNQGKKITAIANKYINYKKISIEKDLTGKDRFIFIFI